MPSRYFVVMVWLLGLLGMPRLGSVVAQDQSYTGTLNDERFFRAFPVTLTEQGGTIVLDLQKTSGDLDPLLFLLNSQGDILAKNDDVESGNSNSRISYYNADAGHYIAIATRYNSQEGKSSGDFALTVTSSPASPAPLRYAFTAEELAQVGYPALEARPIAEWTVLAYYGGSSNLEPALLKDVDEFRRAGGSDESVRVILLIDRLPVMNAAGEWVKQAQLFEVTVDAQTQDIVQTELASINSGDGLTYAKFLTWAIQSYPARQYAMALGGHGAGWRGIITDEVNHSIISLPQLHAALLTAQSLLPPEQKFSLLINDACLMSSVEYYASVAPFFDTSYASPEIVVNPALDMSRLLETLKSQPRDVNLVDLGDNLISTYLQVDMAAINNPFVDYLTHAVTDLQAYDGVVQALNAFAELFLSDPQRHAVALGEARANTYTYSRFLNYSELVDLGHLMLQVIDKSKDVPLKQAAQAVIDALNQVRLKEQGGRRLAQGLAYYNIYFPNQSDAFDAYYLRDTSLTAWGQLLRAYYQQMTYQAWAYVDDAEFQAAQQMASAEVNPESRIPFHAPSPPQVTLSASFPEVSNANLGFVVRTNIIGRNVASGQFVADYALDDGRLQRLLVAPIYTETLQEDGTSLFINHWSSGVDVGTFYWDATLNALNDGTGASLELFTLTDETAALQGRYQSTPEGDWNDVTLLFDQVTGELQRAIAQSNESFADVVIPESALFESYREFVTADGRTVREVGKRYAWGNLRFEPIHAPDGRYDLRFEVMTHNGTVSADSFSAQVDNTAFIPDVTGFVSLEDGVALSVPPNWFPMELRQDDSGTYYYSSNPEEDLFYLFWLIDSLETDLEALLLDLIAQSYGGEVSYSEAFEIDGTPALYFEAEVELGFDDTIVGYVVLNQGIPQAFVLEGDWDSQAFADAFEFLSLNLQLFDRGQEPFWNVFEIENVISPMPSAWLESHTLEDIWDVFSDPEDTTGLVKVRLTQLEVQLTSDNPEDYAQELLDALVQEHVPAGYTPFETKTYFSEYFVWQALLYTDEVRGVRGRLYVTVTEEGGAGYAVWVEAPLDNTAIFQTIYEPIVDGFSLIEP